MPTRTDITAEEFYADPSGVMEFARENEVVVTDVDGTRVRITRQVEPLAVNDDVHVVSGCEGSNDYCCPFNYNGACLHPDAPEEIARLNVVNDGDYYNQAHPLCPLRAKPLLLKLEE